MCEGRKQEKTKKLFSILFVPVLVINMGLVTAPPVSAVELASISPEAANYDLGNPQHLSINLDVGDATDLDSIEDDNGTLSAGTDYYQFENLVVIPSSYLGSVLTCVGEEWIFQVNFDPFGVSFLTVTAVGTAPALEDDSPEWDFWAGGDVIVGIDWGCATDIDDVTDDGGSLGGGDWNHTSTTLNITDSYLTGKLTSMGDTVELTVEFNSCTYPGSLPHTATLTIEAVGVTSPRIAPTSATYDKCNPGDVVFTITWDGAANIGEIWNVTSLSSPSKLTAAVYYTVSGTTLTVKNAYLSYLFFTLGLTYCYLEATFDDSATTKVNILITAEWSDAPFMGVTSNIYTYDLDTGLGNLGTLGVGSLANFGCATNVTGVHDQTGAPVSYSVLYILGYGYLVIIGPAYLGANLTYLEDSATMSVGFDKGDNSIFVINAIGTQPSIDPTSAEFNLDAPADVTTTITWGNWARNVTNVVIIDATAVVPSLAPINYTVTPDQRSSISATLRIRRSKGTSAELEELGENVTSWGLDDLLSRPGDQVVLKLVFDQGEPATFTITAVRTPRCFIATAAYGTPMAEEIEILREFRDEYLLTNPMGQALVDLYYRVSAPMAEFITEHPALKPVVRAALVPAVTMSAVAVNTTSVEKMAIVGLLVLVFVALAVWAKRRRYGSPRYT